MIREGIFKWKAENGFRLRGKEPGRVENFSDAIFALAITLLLISTSPPTNFSQIKRFLYDLLPFAFSIAIIMGIWQQHFIFFLRYGLNDTRVIVLNTFFLMIVLFYVYPLKFLTRLVEIPLAAIMGNDKLALDMSGTIAPGDMGDLMIIYGVGAASVFFIMSLMYRHALKLADKLELNELELFDTRTSVRTNLLMGIIPGITLIPAFLLNGHWSAGMVAGFTYFLYPIVMPLHGRSVDKRRKALEAKLAEPPPEAGS